MSPHLLERLGALRPLGLVLLIPALAGVAYAAHLATGGTLGRERIKAWRALMQSDHRYVLEAEEGGGDCARFGSWDEETLTCTLTRDLADGENILIRADDLTLDGGGFAIRGAGGESVGIRVINQRNVTIRNLDLSGFFDGIMLYHATGCLLTDLRIHDMAEHAIYLDGAANHNRIVDNDIGPLEWHGVALWVSHGNFIAGNEIRGVRDGIRLQNSTGNVILMNYITSSLIEGIDIHISTGNSVLMNDLFEEAAAPILDDTEVPGVNLYSIRYGGNYVMRFDEEAEGCTDGDGDGLCDEPYAFFKDFDHRARTTPATPPGRAQAAELHTGASSDEGS